MLANVEQLPEGKSLIQLKQCAVVPGCVAGKLRDNQSLVTGTETAGTLLCSELFHFGLSVSGI